jgi:hypothetical protein
MAGSFMARLRARAEQLQADLQPGAGFDRSAYGYEDEGADATFEEVALEEDSPWRRDPSGPPRPEPGPEPPPPRAATVSVTRGARREGFDPFGAGGRQSGGGIRRDAPSPPPGEAPAPARTPGAAAAGVRSTPREPERKRANGTSRSRRLRARLRQPDSLRELFLLREVIDRPIALRRPRPRRRRS